MSSKADQISKPSGKGVVKKDQSDLLSPKDIMKGEQKNVDGLTNIYSKLEEMFTRVKARKVAGTVMEPNRWRSSGIEVIVACIASVRDLKAKGLIDDAVFQTLSQTGENLFMEFTKNETPQNMLEHFNSAYHKLQEAMAEEKERRKRVQGGRMSRGLKDAKYGFQTQINRYKLRFEDIASGVYKEGVDETVKNDVTDALKKIKDYDAQKGSRNSRKSGQEEGDVDPEDGDGHEVDDDGNPVEGNNSDDAEGDIQPGYYEDKNGYPHREGSETERK